MKKMMKLMSVALLLLSTGADSRPQHGFQVDLFIMSVEMKELPLTMDLDFRRPGDFAIFSGVNTTLTVKGKLTWEKKFKLEKQRRFNSTHELQDYLKILCQNDGESVGKAKFVSRSGDIEIKSKGYAEKPKGKSYVTAYNSSAGIKYLTVSCD